MKNYRMLTLIVASMSLLAGQFSLAEEIDEEEESDKNPLATLEDMERLLKEQGDMLSAQEKYQLEAWMSYFKSPINFWAQVVDAEGNPMPGAKVRVEVHDDPNLDWEAESKNSVYDLIADANGKIQLLGKQGGGLDAIATAQGYAPFYDEHDRCMSEANYTGGRDPDTNLIPWPTKEAPRKLILRKKGPVSQIKYYPARFLSPSPDGKPLRVDIHDGKYLLEVSLWSSRPKDNKRGDTWDWRAVIKPVNGKIKPRNSMYPHAAPDDGYDEQFEIVMNSVDEEWRGWWGGIEGESWIRWEDGTYAMVDLEISTRRQNRLSVESWINLDRNNSFEDFKKQEMEQRKRR